MDTPGKSMSPKALIALEKLKAWSDTSDPVLTKKSGKGESAILNMYLYVCMYIYIYIYIEIDRKINR